MDQQERILHEVESLLEGTETEVVDVETAGSSRGLVVRVFVDREDGVSIDDCARVSRVLGDHFDAHDAIPGRYVLEVSSPGIDRPLRRAEDFERFSGEQVQVQTFEKVEGKHRHRGRLAGFDAPAQAVLLDEEGTQVSIPLSAIKKANLRRDPWGTNGRSSSSPTAKKRQ